MMIRRDTGIKSLADLKTREIIVASTGTGSPTFLVPKMMNALLGTRFKIVTGYKGSAKTSHSVEQGETFGMSNSWASWKKNRTAWFTGKPDSFALVLAQVGYQREPDLPNVPLLSELAKGADDKAVAAMLSTSSVIGRGLAFPPNVPKKLIKPVRAAFWATVTDPTFVADAKKRLLPVTPLTGPAIQKVVNDALKMSPAAVAKARIYIFGKKK
jgi:tripartite-type tricarboxylate transporter receptor subunit TctC